jgi:putative pyruvate formate lyase activating enzyme
VDRSSGKLGFCGQSDSVRLSWAGIHFGEEPPITGKHGSGTVFFSGCTLKCSFCQNHQISHEGLGREISIEILAEVVLLLQHRGAENINLVTATPFIPSIINSIQLARSKGLSVPVLWNSSGYEGREAIELLDSVVDIYLPDLKTLYPSLSRRLFAAPDYPEVAREALLGMTEKREIVFDGELLQRGVIVRHLVLPGEIESTKSVLDWYRENLDGRTLLSLMFQYTPVSHEDSAPASSVLDNRMITRKEYDQVFEWLEELRIDEGFVQELSSDKTWLPDFSRSNPFSSDLSHTLWHYREGFVEQP